MLDFVRARCRLIPDFWVVVAVCLAMVALFASMALIQPPRDFEGWSAGAALLALFGAIPFYWVISRARGAIIFGENGVRWRTAFGLWKSAGWDEIVSADARMTSTGGKITHWKFVVGTRNGAFSWTNSFENAEQLAPFGARFCPLIAPNVEDWPRRFSYRSGESLLLPLAVLFLVPFFLSAIIKSLIGVQWSDIGAQTEIYVELYGWLLTVLGFASFGLVSVGIPTLFLIFYFLMARQSWQHRDENFLATTQGLIFIVNGKQLFAAWDELQILRVEARGPLVALPFFRLESARGEFHWNNGLCGASQLSQTLFERAPQLKREVQARLREDLNEAPDEKGETLTFNFKKRSLRALLCFGPVLSVSLWSNAIFGPFKLSEKGEPLPTWASFILAVIITAATLYGIQLFRRGCIRLGARGIEWNLPLHKRFVAWEEISGLMADRRLYLRIGARRVPLIVWDIHPTRLNLLVETIAERAFNAGGEWKRVHKTVRR